MPLSESIDLNLLCTLNYNFYRFLTSTMNNTFPSFLVTPSRARLVVWLFKSNCGRKCPAHMYCGIALDEGMLVSFRKVDLPGKCGVPEKVVEVWSDLEYHIWLGDRESLLLPSSPLPLHRLSCLYKLVCIGKGDSLHGTAEIDGCCGVVHTVFTHHSDTRIRQMRKVKTGLP